MKRGHRSVATAYQLAVALPVLGWLVYQAVLDPQRFFSTKVLPALLFWILAVAVVDLMPVSVAGGLQFSLSFPIELAVAFIYLPPVAAAVALLGSFDPREMRREITPLKAVFVRCEIAVSVLAESMVFHQLASIRSAWALLIPAVLAAITAGYVVNTVLVAIYSSLATGTRLRQIVSKMHVGTLWEFLLSYLGLAVFGVVIGRFYLHEGLWSVAVFVAPLVFGRQMYFRSRALSDRLEEQNKLLADQATQLQVHLGQEQHAVAELRELNRIKSEFVAVASHELRTPLTTIIGYAKTLRQPGFADDVALRDECLEAMERQGDRLLRLIENLLTTSHVEKRQLALSVEGVSFADLASELVEGLGHARHRVTANVPSDLPLLHTDRHLLGRVLSNLLDNALKYSPADAVVALAADAQGGSVRFWVQDHGIGIAPEDLDRIFDPFYQADSSSTREYSGVGLGLSLVKELLRPLAAEIDVQSEVGVGSTFTVTVPVDHPALTTPTGEIPTVKAGGRIFRGRSSRTSKPTSNGHADTNGHADADGNAGQSANTLSSGRLHSANGTGTVGAGEPEAKEPVA